MKKKIFLRGISGFPLGVTLGYLITIFISLACGDGRYSPCVPELSLMLGSEINAVLLQAFLCGVLGMGFAACSVIWEIEDWGLVKQTGIYFLIVSLIMMPVAYAAYWMEHSAKGFAGYFGIFTFIFALVWGIQYFRARRSVRKMNESLNKQRSGEGTVKD